MRTGPGPSGPGLFSKMSPGADMKQLSDRFFGFVGLAVSATMVWRATLIQESFIQDPLGPKAFPLVIAGIMALASLAIIISPDEEPDWPIPSRLLEIGAAILVLIAYAEFLPEAGFVISTALAGAYLAWRLGSRPLEAAIAGIVISIGIYLVFKKTLGLSLAPGPVDFIIYTPVDFIFSHVVSATNAVFGSKGS